MLVCTISLGNYALPVWNFTSKTEPVATNQQLPCAHHFHTTFCITFFCLRGSKKEQTIDKNEIYTQPQMCYSSRSLKASVR